MTYEAWRISYQSSEQAARAAFEDVRRLREENERLKASERAAMRYAESHAGRGAK